MMPTFGLRLHRPSALARLRGVAAIGASVVLVLAALTAVAGPAGADALRASIPLPDSTAAISEVAAAGGLIALASDGAHSAVLRVDLATNTVVRSFDLPGYPAPGNGPNVKDLAVADGSVWLAAYFADVVLRLDPVTLDVQATIPTGRSPNGIVAGAGSVWTPLSNDRSVARIDPATNTVVQTIPVGHQNVTSDGPLKIAWNGTQVLASLPGSGRVAHISADGRTVRYDNVGQDAASCATVIAVPDGYWLDDSDCSPFYYHWNTAAGAITATIGPAAYFNYGATFANGALYTAGTTCGDVTCVHGYLVKHDPSTGAVLAKRVVGDEAFLPFAAAGSLWTTNFDAATLQRSPLF